MLRLPKPTVPEAFITDSWQRKVAGTRPLLPPSSSVHGVFTHPRHESQMRKILPDQPLSKIGRVHVDNKAKEKFSNRLTIRLREHASLPVVPMVNTRYMIQDAKRTASSNP